MQRSVIVDRLRREGCRITKQRKIILDIILQEECTCCKEIYFLASKKDPNIGMATIYRMINLLEEIGALKRKSAYRLCDEQTGVPICCVQLDDQTNIRLFIRKSLYRFQNLFSVSGKADHSILVSFYDLCSCYSLEICQEIFQLRKYLKILLRKSPLKKQKKLQQKRNK